MSGRLMINPAARAKSAALPITFQIFMPDDLLHFVSVHSLFPMPNSLLFPEYYSLHYIFVIPVQDVHDERLDQPNCPLHGCPHRLTQSHLTLLFRTERSRFAPNQKNSLQLATHNSDKTEYPQRIHPVGLHNRLVILR